MKEVMAIISSGGSTFQHASLVGAREVKFAIVQRQTFVIDEDFTFDAVTGTLTFITISLSVNDTILVMYKP